LKIMFFIFLKCQLHNFQDHFTIFGSIISASRKLGNIFLMNSCIRPYKSDIFLYNHKEHKFAKIVCFNYARIGNVNPRKTSQC
jgi:hypothetical protein